MYILGILGVKARFLFLPRYATDKLFIALIDAADWNGEA